MPTGISLQLFDGAIPQGDLTGIQALWWDAAEPKDFTRPVGKSTAVTTDASGYISLDLSNVTGLASGDYGFLMLYKKDSTDSNDSLVFSGKVQTSTITSGVDMYYYDSGWTRPADWLPLPDVTGQQRFVGLHAVYPDSSFCALSAAGAYTVDWGDGTVENVASGVTASHQYNYTTYDVAGATLCSRGYKQVIVSVTPQVGQDLTALNLQVHYNPLILQMYSSGFLDIAVAGPLLSTLSIGASSQVVNMSMLKQASIIGANTIGSFAYVFFNCPSLQSVPLLNTSAGTDFSGMFASCYSLQSVPLLNTSAGTSFSYMFSSCYSLQSVPLLNTSAGTDFSGMFDNCYSLQTVPLLDTSAGTNFSYMFQACPSLQSVPLLNTSAGTDFSYMFSSCYSLQSVPLLNTSAGTDFSCMFGSCYSLQIVPLLDTSAGTNFSGMFDNCYSLQTVPLLDTSAGTYFSYMFSACYSLQTVPLLNTSAGTSFSYMFSSCYSLQSVPLLNTSAGTDFSGMFDSCASLSSAALSGTKNAISYAGCKLSAAALNDIYANLATVTSKTITVTGNWGTASDNPTIARAKGWTVTG